MKLLPERLASVRNSLGLNKAEAARKLNMSAMGYGRYEKGERVPSYQTLCFIAHTFKTTPEYLCGKTDFPFAESITIFSNENPDLYLLIEKIQNSPDNTAARLLEYLKLISKM